MSEISDRLPMLDRFEQMLEQYNIFDWRPALIDGQIVLTPEQKVLFDEATGPPVAIPRRAHELEAAGPMYSIQIVVLQEGEQKDMGGGWVAVNRYGHIYALRGVAWQPPARPGVGH